MQILLFQILSFFFSDHEVKREKMQTFLSLSLSVFCFTFLTTWFKLDKGTNVGVNLVFHNLVSLCPRIYDAPLFILSYVLNAVHQDYMYQNLTFFSTKTLKLVDFTNLEFENMAEFWSQITNCTKILWLIWYSYSHKALPYGSCFI